MASAGQPSLAFLTGPAPRYHCAVPSMALVTWRPRSPVHTASRALRSASIASFADGSVPGPGGVLALTKGYCKPEGTRAARIFLCGKKGAILETLQGGCLGTLGVLKGKSPHFRPNSPRGSPELSDFKGTAMARVTVTRTHCLLLTLCPGPTRGVSTGTVHSDPRMSLLPPVDASELRRWELRNVCSGFDQPSSVSTSSNML